MQWLDEWQQTEEGRAWATERFAYDAKGPQREASPHFTASVSRDGTFRLDDMPAGDYSLSIRFSRNAAGRLPNYGFSVPPMEGNRSGEELDLGVLALE